MKRLDSTWSGFKQVQLFSQTCLLVSPVTLATPTGISTESSKTSSAESDGNVTCPGYKPEYTSQNGIFDSISR